MTMVPRTIINMADIPDDAHISFACPYCERQHLLTPLDTRAASHVTLTEAQIRFHAIQCPACRQTMTFEATLISPLPLSDSDA